MPRPITEDERQQVLTLLNASIELATHANDLLVAAGGAVRGAIKFMEQLEEVGKENDADAQNPHKS